MILNDLQYHSGEFGAEVDRAVCPTTILARAVRLAVCLNMYVVPYFHVESMNVREKVSYKMEIAYFY